MGLGIKLRACLLLAWQLMGLLQGLSMHKAAALGEATTREDVEALFRQIFAGLLPSEPSRETWLVAQSKWESILANWSAEFSLPTAEAWAAAAECAR